MAITIPDQNIRNSVPAIGEALITLATETAALDAGDVPATRQVIAGAGLTGGGDLSADRTLNVVANADASIVVNANDIQVGVLASDAQHGTRGGGTQHAVATTNANGFMSSTDKTRIDSIQTGTATLVLGTIAVATATITASSKVYLTHSAANASTALGALFAEGLTPGAPGSFTINARKPADATVETGDVSGVSWLVVS